MMKIIGFLCDQFLKIINKCIWYKVKNTKGFIAKSNHLFSVPILPPTQRQYDYRQFIYLLDNLCIYTHIHLFFIYRLYILAS